MNPHIAKHGNSISNGGVDKPPVMLPNALMVLTSLLKQGQAELVNILSLQEQFEVYASLENMHNPFTYITNEGVAQEKSATKQHTEYKYYLND